jgi:hypothetical protein
MPRQLNVGGVNLAAVQIGQQKAKVTGDIDIHANQAPAIGFESEHIRRSPATRLAFTHGLNQTGARQIGDDIRHRGRG